MVINVGDPLYRPFPNGRAPFNAPGYRQDSLRFDPQFVVGGNTVAGTLTLAAPAPTGGTEVTFANTRPEAVTVPDKILIPGGETTTTFPLTTEVATAYQAAVITAAYEGKTCVNTLGIVPLLDAITLPHPVVASGAPVRGTIFLNDVAPRGGVVITLTSDHPAIARPENVVLPAGQTRAAFTLVPNLVAATTDIVISASLNGTHETARLTVVPTRRRIVATRRAP
jgi:hypothetical protein